MKLELITELVESRMFRNETELSKINSARLMEYFYISVLFVNSLRHERQSAAKSYANSTLRYTQFDSVKSSASDLYNLAVAVLKQHQFPEMAFKRWLHDVVADRTERRQDYELFTGIESALKIDSAALRSLRRISLDYHLVSHTEQVNFWTTVKRYMAQHLKTIDLLPLTPKI